IDDTEWLLHPEVQPAIAAMLETGLRFDALVQPRHLPMLRTFCTRYPSLPVVIDHCAKPAIASGAWQPWADDIRRLAQETSAYCKLSGLVTEAARDWRTEDLRRYVDHLIDCFGPARLM